jgi:hypothetical protein
MKRILLLLPVLLFGSCSDFLEKPPLTSLSESSYWVNGSDVEYAVNGLYEAFYELDGGGAFSPGGAPYYDILTDLVWLYASWEFGGYDLTSGSLNADNSWINSFWSKKYQYIRNCNFFFENVDKVRDKLSDAQYRDFCGQARTIRAFLYLRLLQAFGDVPLVRNTLSADDWPGRDNADDIINFIISELDQAIEELPAIQSDERHGRIYKDVARAYKARTALHVAGFYGRTEYYQIAADALKPLVENPDYELWKKNSDPVDNFDEIFWAANEGADNKEVIFSDQFMKERRPNNMSTCLAGPGWKGLQASQNLIDQFECTDGWQANEIYFADMNKYRNTKVEKSPLDGKSSLYDPKDEMKNRDPRLNATFWNPNLYIDEADGRLKKHGEYWVAGNRNFAADRENDCYFPKKLVDPTNYNPEYYYGNSDNNYPLIRLSDMYLLYAEAMNETGRTDVAETYVNKVRERVNMPPIRSSDQTEMLDIIKHERKVELLFENILYWDYKRWKDLEKTMPYGSEFYGFRREAWGFESVRFQQKFLTFPKYNLWPIPSGELRNNPNMNQNEGW